jgi:lipopolysaccharide/colanic/teichoic acid biosynthesis glycosyltransferase
MDQDGLVDYPASKRLLDKVLAVALLILASPLIVVLLVAMAFDMLLVPSDRGRFLYRETRVSRGREFGLLKFRTLRRSAVRSQAGGEAHARLLEADSQNLTWAGRRLLKPWYLDEVPQLLNVLKGDMSLVGPRPWPPSLVEQQVAAGLDYRNRIVAGWTGPAQVQKDVTAPESYAELDLGYVEACRTWGSGKLVRYDLSLLWQTVKLLARGEGLRF